MSAALAIAAPDRRPQHLPADLVVLLCMVSGLLLLVFPFAAFALAGFLLVNLPADTPRHVRLSLALALAVALAMMTGARPLDPDAPNDIDVYYDVYQELAAGHLDALASFGGGLEVALPLLSWIWSLVLPPLSPNGLMFCCALTSSVLMLAWVEKAFYVDRGWRDPALMGVCLLLLNLYFSTQLVRQFMALIVLLYAFSARTRARRWSWVLLAASFHLTALPFYALYLLARRGPRGWLAIVAIAFIARSFFWDLVAALDIVPAAVAEKLAFYVDNTAQFTEADLTSLRMIGLLGVISLAALAANRFRAAREARPWLAVPWVTALVHFALLPIPLASLRTTLMVHSVAPGLVAYRMFGRRAGLALVLVLNVLFLYKVLSFAAAEPSGNLLSAVSMLGAFLR